MHPPAVSILLFQMAIQLVLHLVMHLLWPSPSLAADDLSVPGSDPLEAVRNVTLAGRRAPAAPPHTPLLRPVPAPDSLAAGRLLLHRRGCTGCHDLDVPAYPHRRGPDLDHIGSKTHPAWLDLWLREPTRYLPESRMPRVRMGDASRSRLVTWLGQLGRVAPGSDTLDTSAVETDVYRGGRLFEGLQCRGCHAAGGEGGHIGPALDRLGWKVRPGWLAIALRDPGAHGLDASSHPYDLSVRDATDLSAFLLRRFAPPGGPVAAGDSDVGSDGTPAGTGGLAEAVVQGCFQCHTVKHLLGPRLRLPVDGARAASWLAWHGTQRGALPAIALAADEAAAMAAALQAAATGTGAAVDSLPATAFWDLPIAAQGTPRPLFAAGRRLEPSACGQCHEKQLQAWSASRHAQTFSPGLRAMLHGGSAGFLRECLACHAPREEQIASVQEHAENDGYGPAGVDCAACHVRAHRHFGPGAAPQSRPVAATFEAAHHGGAEAAPELFGDARFCAPCHQFAPDGLALEGKLLQNTYGEWLASPAARSGQTCQDCHMPGGDHRMRGLHDREFVRAAVQFDATWQVASQMTNQITNPAGHQSGHQSGGQLQVTLRNVGAGHALPTYATGALRVKMFLSDAHDGVIESTLRQRSAQRRLGVDGQSEVFDTRIPAGGSWTCTETFVVPDEASHVNVLVEVDPDHFYRRFFALLNPEAAEARALLEQARGRISESPYILFARQIDITRKD